ncbi:methionine aminotransferase [Nonlabens spongiae]|uniref:Methionine aminotransferase n=1 Tax=Nonlabens spongiae TaxID=331648 RepID=A0A1W6MLU1_9FLAO|nr:methionine aminotransferase [Nonlabens spongiae]ARN78568.1 methionine aminotransferase [Nonlabens spongiae]
MLKSKLPHLPESIFAKMTKMAIDHNAINMSQGFPSFSTDQELKDLLSKAIQEDNNQYAPMTGILDLRIKISNLVSKLYGGTYKPDGEICITPGATQGIYTAIQSVVQKGDEVIIITPAYDLYAPAIKLAGGRVVEVAMELPSFSVDWNKVEAAVSSKTKLIIVNTPHNPSGAIFSEHDWKQLEQIVNKHDLYVLSDEVYEHMVFDGKKHLSAASRPLLRDRTFITCSFGKTFHVTGWKCGYCLAPEPLMKEFLKIHQQVVFCVNRPVQHAMSAYLTDSKNYLELGTFYQHKRDLFLELIKDSKFKFVPTPSTYFQLLDFSEITDESDVKFAERLTREFKVASIPISVFMNGTDPQMLRFCFAKKDEELIEGAEILLRL